MMLPYGPVPLTAGIVTFQDVDSGAAWVVVENVSLFLYLGVSFWPSKPQAVTVFNGQPWNAVIQPGGTLRIECPKQGWLGRIWLLGVDASAQSAAVGTVSSYSSALLRTYGPNDEASDSPSVVRGLDILSQQRIVSLPMANYTGASVLDFSGNLPGAAPNPFIISDITLSAENIANQVYWYLGGMYLLVDAGAAGRANFTANVVLRDNVGTVLTSRTLFSFTVYTSAAVAPNNPYQELLSPPWGGFFSVHAFWPTAVSISIQIVLNACTAALLGQPCFAHSNFMIDSVNMDLAGQYGWPLVNNPQQGSPKF